MSLWSKIRSWFTVRPEVTCQERASRILNDYQLASLVMEFPDPYRCPYYPPPKSLAYRILKLKQDAAWNEERIRFLEAEIERIQKEINRIRNAGDYRGD